MNTKLFLPAFLLLSLAACSTSPTGRSQLKLYSNAQISQQGALAFTQIKEKQKVSKSRVHSVTVLVVVGMHSCGLVQAMA